MAFRHAMPAVVHLLAVILLTLPQLAAGRSCYTRNGTQIADIAFQPCSSSGDSACCATNNGGAGKIGIANDVCDPNGLCRNFEGFDGSNEGEIVWWRKGCTDPSWNSPDCLGNVCNTAEYQEVDAPVYSCGSGNWACEKQSYCSATPRVFVLAQTLGGETSTYTSASVLGTASISGHGASSLPTPSSSALPATDTAELAHLSTAIKAGIGAGVTVLVLMLGIIVYLLHKIKKNKKQQEAHARSESPDQSLEAGEKPDVIVSAREVPPGTREMPSNEPPAHEMYGYRERAELETTESIQERGRARERV